MYDTAYSLVTFYGNGHFYNIIIFHTQDDNSMRQTARPGVWVTFNIHLEWKHFVRGKYVHQKSSRKSRWNPS